MRNRLPLLWAAISVVLVVLAGGIFVVPEIIHRAYHGESVPLFDRLISGRTEHPVDFYLSAWRRLFWQLFAAAMVGSAFLVVRRRPPFRRFGKWLGAAPAWKPMALLGVCVWFGAVAGIAESLQAIGRYLLEHHPSRPFRWEGAWMAPWTGMLVFGSLGVAGLAVTYLLGRPLRAPVSAAAVVFVLSFVAVVGVVADAPLGLHPYAIVLLACGIGAALARSVRARPGRWEGVLRRSRPFLAGALAVTTVIGLLHLPIPLEQRRLAALGPPRDGLPDVVLIILDTVRASSLGLYGYANPTTPHLERRAREGIVFTRAIAPAPWTLPSHASMFTGRLPGELGADLGEALDETYPTLAEVLAESGYHTAGFTANTFNTGEPSGLARGFHRYEDFPVTWGWFLKSTFLGRWIAEHLPYGQASLRLTRKTADLNTDDFIAWLDDLDTRRPFFAFLNYMDAHAPYQSPNRFRVRFPSDRRVIQPVAAVGLSEEELEGTRSAYDAAIAFLDEEVERILEALEKSRRRDLLVIITSDHGEFFGEHGQVEHGGALYEPVLRVPLVLLGSRIPGGTTIDASVSTAHLARTITDVALGVSDERLGGRSLRPLWSAPDSSSGFGPAVSERTLDSLAWHVPTRQVLSVFVGSHHYIRSHDGEEELFDLSTDPREERDLSDAAAARPILRRLSSLADSIGGFATRLEAWSSDKAGAALEREAGDGG